MTLKQDLQPWRTPEGTLLNADKSPSGNSLCYFGHEIQIEHELQQLVSPIDFDNFNLVVRAHYLDGFPGILNRSPGDTSYKQAHDDYIPIAAAAQLLDSPIAKEILKALQDADWDGENQQPTIWNPSSWFTIRAGVVAHIKMCAGETPKLLDMITWYFRVTDVAGYDFKKDGASGPLLVWHYIKAYERYKAKTKRNHWLLDKAMKIWYSKLEEKEPVKLMGSAFECYFGATHPLTLAMMGRK